MLLGIAVVAVGVQSETEPAKLREPGFNGATGPAGNPSMESFFGIVSAPLPVDERRFCFFNYGPSDFRVGDMRENMPRVYRRRSPLPPPLSRDEGWGKA